MMMGDGVMQKGYFEKRVRAYTIREGTVWIKSLVQIGAQGVASRLVKIYYLVCQPRVRKKLKC